MDYVMVRNSSDEDFSDTFDGQGFVIKAGTEMPVPRDAAVLWFGDFGLLHNKDPKIAAEESARVLGRRASFNPDDFEVYEMSLPKPPTGGDPATASRKKPKRGAVGGTRGKPVDVSALSDEELDRMMPEPGEEDEGPAF